MHLFEYTINSLLNILLNSLFCILSINNDTIGSVSQLKPVSNKKMKFSSDDFLIGILVVSI